MAEENPQISAEERRKIQINARLKFQNWFKTPDAIIMSTQNDTDGQLLEIAVLDVTDGSSVFYFVRHSIDEWSQIEGSMVAKHEKNLSEIEKALQLPYFLQELKEIVSHRLVVAYHADAHARAIQRAFDIDIQPVCLKKAYAELCGQWDSQKKAWSTFDQVNTCKQIGLSIEKIQSALDSAKLSQKILEYIGSEKIGHVNIKSPIGEAMMTSEGQVGIAYQHIYNDDLFEFEHGGWYTIARKPVTNLEKKRCKEMLDRA